MTIFWARNQSLIRRVQRGWAGEWVGEWMGGATHIPFHREKVKEGPRAMMDPSLPAAEEGRICKLMVTAHWLTPF